MKRINKVLCTILFAIAVLLITTKVEAATATISASSNTATVGDNVNIIVKYTAASWELTASGTGIATTKYVDVTDDAENATTTKTIKLDTSTAGTKEIKLTGTVSDGTTGQTTPINTSVKVTVNAKPTDNGENGGGSTSSEPKKGSVTSCEVDGIKIKESRNVTNKDSVSVKVVTSTGEGLTIYNNKTKKSYSAKSGQAVNVQIMEGTNTLTITLETGATATRKVYSKKQEEVKPNVEEPSVTEPEPEQPQEQEEVAVGLQSLVINGVTAGNEKIALPFTPTFASDVYEYSMLLDHSFSEDFMKLDVEAVALQEDFVVEITGLEEELKDGENVITITVKSADGGKVVTYKVTVTKEAEVMPISAPVEEKTQEEIKPIWNETQQIIIVVFTSVVALMGIIYAVVEYRYGKNKEESQIPYSGLDFEKEVEEEPEKKKKKSKKQQKLEAEEEAENFFGRMTTQKEETVNSILDDNKQEKTDDTNKKDEMPNLDNIFGTNNMNQNIEDISKQPRKRGKHF